LLALTLRGKTGTLEPDEAPLSDLAGTAPAAVHARSMTNVEQMRQFSKLMCYLRPSFVAHRH
jgi:hypothetical protein